MRKDCLGQVRGFEHDPPPCVRDEHSKNRCFQGIWLRGGIKCRALPGQRASCRRSETDQSGVAYPIPYPIRQISRRDGQSEAVDFRHVRQPDIGRDPMHICTARPDNSCLFGVSVCENGPLEASPVTRLRAADCPWSKSKAQLGPVEITPQGKILALVNAEIAVHPFTRRFGQLAIEENQPTAALAASHTVILFYPSPPACSSTPTRGRCWPTPVWIICGS